MCDETPTTQKDDKNEQTAQIGAWTFSKWAFEIFIII